MRLTRAAASLVSIVLFAAPALADVTMKMTMATAGGPASVETVSVTFIKGMKMRSDVKVAGQDMSLFVDVAAKQQLMVNNATKEVTDVGAMTADLPMGVGEVKLSVKPSGQTKSLLGRTCAGYTTEITMPMTMMGQTLTMTISGMVWIAKDAPGAAEYLAFNKAAVAAGLGSGLLAQGPQAKGLSQMQAAFAELGMPLEQELQIAIAGTGQMAEALAQSGAGNIKMTTKVTEISLDSIPAETYVIPGVAPKK